jgi:hypothetical protein
MVSPLPRHGTDTLLDMAIATSLKAACDLPPPYQEVAEKGVLILPTARKAVAESPPKNKVTQRAPKPRTEAPAKVEPERREPPVSPRSAPSAPVAPPAPANGIPMLFRRENIPKDPPEKVPDLPSDVWSNGQSIPLDRWMLGQQNRLLPAKVNSRAFAHLFLENPKGLPIAEATTRIAANAAVLGEHLRKLDVELGSPRDDALATAFPANGDEAEKSISRYANQFVVYQNTRGELSGLMVDLKLINILHSRRDRLVVPTKVAWEFAAMPNPVLDGQTNGAVEKFSPEERDFLINHIRTSVPVEAFAYKLILSAVRDGHESPEQIDTALKAHVTEGRDDLSQSFLASQRSGAISRMSDLNLIARRRDGVRVFYSVTQQGLNFLSQCANH